jgi:hypothetical protein
MGSKKNNVDMSKIKTNQCLGRQPFYLALNLDIIWGKEFINLLNDLFSRDKSKQILSAIIKRYTTH